MGAIAVPIFSGFGVDAVATRLEDAECSVLFTGDGFYRRGDPVFLKSSADEAIEQAGYVEDVIVFDRLGSSNTQRTRDSLDRRPRRVVGRCRRTAGRRLRNEIPRLEPGVDAAVLVGDDGETEGIVHTHAGVQIQCAKELYFGFDLKPADRFFWVSDIGWMMGPWTLIGVHTFGGTVFMYEGAPDYPGPDRFWEMIDRHELTQFGISPTAIRALRNTEMNRFPVTTSPRSEYSDRPASRGIPNHGGGSTRTSATASAR